MRYRYVGTRSRKKWGVQEEQVPITLEVDLEQLVDLLLDQLDREHTDLFSGYEGSITLKVREASCLKSGKTESTQSRNPLAKRRAR